MALDAIGLDGEAAAGRGGYGDGSVGADGDFGLDDVLRPVAVGGGDVAGEREVRQRGEGDVVGAADAGLEHAAAPDGDAELLGDVVDGDGFGEAADAAYLDVDDLAAAEFEGGARVAAVADALVEADAGLDAALQHGVEVEVVVPERLLDHEQIELVPVGDVVDVVEAIGGVGVAAEQDVGPALAHHGEDVGVPAGLALELDALVAGGELGLRSSP